MELHPPEGDVITHEERGTLQTVPEDAPQPDVIGGSATGATAPPRAYMFQTAAARTAVDMQRYPQIHMVRASDLPGRTAVPILLLPVRLSSMHGSITNLAAVYRP